MGARWDPAVRLWKMSYKAVKALNLHSRVHPKLTIAQSLQPRCSRASSGACALRFWRASSVAAVTSRLRCVNQAG